MGFFRGSRLTETVHLTFAKLMHWGYSARLLGEMDWHQDLARVPWINLTNDNNNKSNNDNNFLCIKCFLKHSKMLYRE